MRWWDGTNWTEHVSAPAPVEQVQQAIAAAPVAVAQPAVQQAAAVAEVPQVAEADAALAAADAEHVEYIGRHAAGANPAPRQPATAPRIRPRVRVEVPAEHFLYA